VAASTENQSIRFFERQFRRQIAAGEYALNPFERMALEHLQGNVLDLGCGLGNLACAAARRGARVTALDAAAAAIGNLERVARAEGLEVKALQCDLRGWRPVLEWDAIACIGLLMFFPCAQARAVLGGIRSGVRAGGVAAVNVLVEGTTFLDMFDASGHCLFEAGELERAFAGWTLLAARRDDFPAPNGTVKRFETVVARRPA
jgi:tellurite methyltransferase